MRISLIVFLGISLSACSFFQGNSGKVQNAYYVPVIQGDKSQSSGSQGSNSNLTPVQISDQKQTNQDPYVPVILP
ncbi:hypothetical protein [Marinomonas mediterranea]|jgi:hypothetical protein|uniref:Lipoprotein n=1 Tax=Marinomonas mediterranea (strain ATCC 700492 / JCM 21426 / NBRC 103028 / MMB-1) TaxID=717774 RepID=F2JTZ2_MARM1|nr:hypothetical protein [Marinomonas mediterranea]ADZ90413.1 hypothetical protein Marme_1138 [Marinomonas mediterranea MMB-1]WCN08467.1 hypothetical protein GV055_05785 [Marinomonas mediterranea]WCN12522.1 hypothetical protein GV054_05625 [Marinomonas mediterranea]WCN16594.1 hypothetical protein GV053_05755 [Marinomonas mediterranea MMB-1]